MVRLMQNKRVMALHALVLGFAVLAGFFASLGVSQASTGMYLISKQTAPMTRINCAHPLPQTLQTIQKYHLCAGAKGAQVAQSGVSPDNEVVGDCGTATLWLYGTTTKGQTRFFEQLVSVDGKILNVNYSIDWNNNNAKTAGVIANNAWGQGGVTWTNNDYRNTGAGTTSGVMDGTAFTLFDICVIGGASDSVYHS